MKRARLLLADDHTLLLDAFRNLLEPEFEIVGTVEDGRSLLEAAPKLNPDVILIDVAMPLLNGIEAARRLKKMMPHTKLIFLTMHGEPSYVTQALHDGASGYVLKRSAASELVAAIHEVLKGGIHVTPLVTKGMVDTLVKGPPKPLGLTARQARSAPTSGGGKVGKENREPPGNIAQNRRIPPGSHQRYIRCS